MKNSEKKIPSSLLVSFRIVLYLCGLYFFLMGLLLLVFPQLAIKNTGVQNPTILGILRGTGGSVLFSSVWYIMIAQKPIERRLIAFIMAVANIWAVVLDLITVALREFTMSHAMIDIPVELLSFFAIVTFYYITHRISYQS
jgi:hypothetical protein